MVLTKKAKEEALKHALASVFQPGNQPPLIAMFQQCASSEEWLDMFMLFNMDECFPGGNADLPLVGKCLQSTTWWESFP